MQTSIKTITQVRELAKQQLSNYKYEVDTTPIETLLSFPWKEIQVNSGNLPTNNDYAIWNLQLDPQSCLGRIAMAGVLVEEHFPDSEIRAGEVLQDELRNTMKQQVKESLPDDMQLRKEWLDELLMYELPHSVIVIDSLQFDSLSTSFGAMLEHEIKQFPFWEHVLAAVYAAQADFASGIIGKLKLLDEAEEVCPGFTLLKEKRAGLLMAKGDPEGVKLLQEAQEIRPTADNLFALWAWEDFRNDSQYKKALEKQYIPAIIEHLITRTGVDHEFITGRA